MAGSWQAAKRAVESHFTDKCRVTEFTEEETSWGGDPFQRGAGQRNDLQAGGRRRWQ